MFYAIKTRLKAALAYQATRTLKRRFENQVFTRFNERPVEFSFVFRKLSETYPRRVLDVGTGTTALPALMGSCGAVVTATDNVTDYWPVGMTNVHYHILDDDICSTKLSGRFDFITCVSVLEHIESYDAAVSGMFSLLAPHGHLILTCPYTAAHYVPNVYDLPDSSYGQDEPYVTQSFSRENLERWLDQNTAVLVEQECWQFWEGDAWTQGQQVIPPKQVDEHTKHQLTCLHLTRR